jgi:hypothetical protein
LRLHDTSPRRSRASPRDVRSSAGSWRPARRSKPNAEISSPNRTKARFHRTFCRRRTVHGRQPDPCPTARGRGYAIHEPPTLPDSHAPLAWRGKSNATRVTHSFPNTRPRCQGAGAPIRGFRNEGRACDGSDAERVGNYRFSAEAGRTHSRGGLIPPSPIQAHGPTTSCTSMQVSCVCGSVSDLRGFRPFRAVAIPW